MSPGTVNKMDILIFGGQSNMQGQTERLSENAVVPGAYEYRLLTDTVIPLQNPVGEHIRTDRTPGYLPTLDRLDQWLADHIVGAACSGNTNLVPAFCRAYIRQTGREVLAVHAAKGSTVIAQWLPGTDGYRLLVDKARAAMGAVPECGRVFFVWLQGESDAIVGNSRAYYKEKLLELNRALQQDVGIQTFGIIRVGPFSGDSRDEAIIGAQDEICQERADFLMLTTLASELFTQPTYMNPHVPGHFSAAGAERLGSAAGDTLGAYVAGEL